uniref:Aggrecan core protein-like n=1 Tax=Saccoglossus kowalevskii TaxID=10224 RepID=A0ABM0MVX1_SACKO|nr:PREDICTED: aggrecan core protein-like [Saccoglossus kowalevskii]
MAEEGETNGTSSLEDITDNAEDIWKYFKKGLKELRERCNCCKNASTTNVATATAAAVVLVAVIAGIIVAVVLVTGTTAEISSNVTNTANVSTFIPTTTLFTTNEFTSVDITTTEPDTTTVEVSTMPSTTEKTTEPADTTTDEVSTMPSTTEKTTEPADTTTDEVSTMPSTTEKTTEPDTTTEEVSAMRSTTEKTTEPEMVTTIDVTTESWTRTTLPFPTIPPTTATHDPTTRDRRYIDIECIRYYVYNDTQTWESSEQLCENVGAVLASLYTSKISDGVIQFIIDRNLDDGTISYWIGLNDISEEGSFEWLNGDPYGYTNWAPRNPDNWRNQDCGQLWTSRNFQWDDDICSNDNGYICQSPLDDCSDTTTPGWASDVSSTKVPSTAFTSSTLYPDRRYIDIGCSRYSVHNDTQTWANSEQLCEDMGAVLASLYTSTVSDDVIQFIIDSNMDDGAINYWIGLNEHFRRGKF